MSLAPITICNRHRHISESVFDKRHVFRWKDGAECIEQDVLVIDAANEELFPSGDDWRRLSLGCVVVFLRRPAV